MSEGTLSQYSSDHEQPAYAIQRDIDMVDEEDSAVTVESTLFTEHYAVIGKIPMGIFTCAKQKFSILPA
jgi:hypothetical protein